MEYVKSKKYADYHTNPNNIGGPGGLKLAEFMAEKMSLMNGKKLIDIGFCQGFQTCFLAKEYGIDIVAIDPGGEHAGYPYGVETLMENSRQFGVENKILGIKTGVPDTLLPCDYFDYAYTTTCLEMLRGQKGSNGYLAALKEIHRILKKGGILGLAEPMCLDLPIPDEITKLCTEYSFDKCFETDKETKKAVSQAGFKVLEYGYCKEANEWWKDNVSNLDTDNDYRKAIELMIDSRWLSFGYVIALKE